MNIDTDEKLVGIEILDAKDVLGSGKLPSLAVENVPLSGAQHTSSVVREKPVRKSGK